MAAKKEPAKKVKAASTKTIKTVESGEYNKLEMYCIWLNEFYTSLMRSGFTHSVALALITDKEAYPEWVNFKLPTDIDVSKYMEEED
jgi:hypothetical protein